MPDLITLARAKQGIAITTSADDAKIQTLIAAASEAIERWCGRRFASATYDEIKSVESARAVRLDQFPVTAVSRVSVGRTTALTVVNTDSITNQRSSVQVTSTGLLLVRVASATTVSDTSVTWLAQPRIENVASAVVGLGAGWSAQAVSQFVKWPSAELAPLQGAYSCLGRNVPIAFFGEEMSEYELNGATGELVGAFPRGSHALRVQYAAGYLTIPADVQEACARLVAAWFAQSNQTAGLSSESLGVYAYSRLRSMPSLPAEVRALVAPYRDRRL